MKTLFSIISVLLVQSMSFGYIEPIFPYAPVIGESGSVEVAHDDQRIAGWATSVNKVIFGPQSDDETLRDPGAVIGPATLAGSGVLVLGRGGEIILEFAVPISNQSGPDFAVFENAFSDSFLELAFVEVSSDGQHFARFPSYSQTLEPVGTWGNVQASFLHNLACKYPAGYGTPFDLDELRLAYEGLQNGYNGFSPSYKEHLEAQFPFVDVGRIRFIRLVDIIGDGSALDCQGFEIYDPFPTFITAGFDLDAVAVLNQAGIEPVDYVDWAIGFGLSGGGDRDSDGDNWIDKVEFHFGTSPVDPEVYPLGKVVESLDGQSTDLLFERNASANGEILVFRLGESGWEEYSSWTGPATTASDLHWRNGMPFVYERLPISSASGADFYQFAAGGVPAPQDEKLADR